MAEFEFTKEYLEAQKSRVFKNNMVYVKSVLDKLYSHLTGIDYMHPKQVNHMISNCLSAFLELNEYSYETYNSLDHKTKKQINDHYEKEVKWEPQEGKVRGTPDEIKQALWNSIRDTYKDNVTEAEEFIENN